MSLLGMRYSLLPLTVLLLGFTALVTQLTFVRELLDVFAGNELVLGILLGSWLLLSGLGAWLGRLLARRVDAWTALARVQPVLALLPPAELFLVRSFRHLVLMRGVTPSPLETVLASLGVLAPFCLLSGAVLTLACAAPGEADEERGRIGRLYALDGAGSILGGLLFTAAAALSLSPFLLLYLTAFLHLVLAIMLGYALRRTGVRWAARAGVVALAGAAVCNLDAVSTRLECAGQNVLWSGLSPYGRLVVGESSGQYNFMRHGVTLFSTGNIEALEETVGFALAQRPAHAAEPEQVLLLGGGASGTAALLARSGVARVDYVELDPLVLSAARRFMPENLADERIRVVTGDGRRYVAETGERYGLVLVDLPDPATAELNRFYTREFFASVKRILAPGGVLALGLGQYNDYVSPELARLLASLRTTLQSCFRHVLLLPDRRIFASASDGPLTQDLATPLAARWPQAQYMNRDFLDFALTPDRLADVAHAAEQPAEPNTDLNPVLYYYHLRYWLAQFQTPLWGLAGVLLAALALYVFTRRAVPFAVFTTGFAASGLELAVILGFQAVYGSLYHQLGLLFTAFMAGLVVGAWLAGRRGRSAAALEPSRARMPLVAVEGALALLAAVLPAMLAGLVTAGCGAWPAWAGQAVFLALLFALALLAGLEFALAARVDFRGAGETAGGLYLADFLGAALGAVLAGALLIPRLGVLNVCLLTAGLKLLSCGVVWWRGKVAA